VVLRGLALLHLADGMTVRETARALKKLTAKTVRSVARNYRECGLDRALYEKPRPGAEQLLIPAEKQSILAMVSGDPPDGRARWTVRLIVEEAVNRKVVSQVGRETRPSQRSWPQAVAAETGKWLVDAQENKPIHAVMTY